MHGFFCDAELISSFFFFFKGAAEPIIGKHMGCLLWEGHGKDGLGDVFSLPPSTVREKKRKICVAT